MTKHPSRRQWQSGKIRDHKKPSSEGKFSWQANDAVLVIRRYFADHDGPLAYTLALYSTLIDRASQDNTEEFRASHRELGCLSGMSISQVKKVLAVLLELGLVAWQPTFSDNGWSNGGGIRDQGPNTYRLLSIKKKTDPGSAITTPGRVKATHPGSVIPDPRLPCGATNIVKVDTNSVGVEVERVEKTGGENET